MARLASPEGRQGLSAAGRRAAALAAALATAALATAALASSCGGSGRHGSGEAITLLTSAAPGSLDPAVASGMRALEADWLAYTPLLTYAHSSGVTGTRLIPGLATDLPAITDSGTTYSFTLRAGLRYATGRPVRASDFAWAVERAIRLGWSGAGKYILGHLAGARAFAQRRARTISGITTNDATGQITIRLTAAFGQFDDVLALPALAPVPASTPIRDDSRAPPPGAGPYELTNVVPGRSFALIRNPAWAHGGIPGIPAGHVDIHVRVSPDLRANARAVLAGRADALDPADPIPPGFARRSSSVAADATYAIFMDPARGPLSSGLARQAVVTAAAAARGEGTLRPGCYLLPPPMAGHPSAPCPYGDPDAGGGLLRARALVRRSGFAGARVSVSGGMTAVSLLDRIGLDATQAPAHGAQAALALASPDLPSPAAFYARLTARDPHIEAQLRLLGAVPAAQLGAVSYLWAALDEYTARKAYVAVLGYPSAEALVSSRIDAGALIFQPVVGIDWSSFTLA